MAVDQETGKVLWQKDLPGPTWGSPVPIDEQILVGDCAGVLHNFDISNPRKKPKELWVSCRGASSRPRRMGRDDLGGARGGAIYGIGDALVPSNRTIAEWFGHAWPPLTSQAASVNQAMCLFRASPVMASITPKYCDDGLGPHGEPLELVRPRTLLSPPSPLAR